MRSRNGPDKRAITADLIRRAATAARMRRRDNRTDRGSLPQSAGMRRELSPARRAGNADTPRFGRLAQHFQHLAVEFRQLVEKQHAVMSQRNFPGRGILPPPPAPRRMRNGAASGTVDAPLPVGWNAPISDRIAADSSAWPRSLPAGCRAGAPPASICRYRAAEQQQVMPAGRRDFQ